MTTSRVDELTHLLRLAPHPEGGRYREIYRSADRVQPVDGRPPRSALTTIHFLLAAGEQSRWHAVRSDEVWHFYEGEPLELLLGPPDMDRVARIVLGPVARTRRPAYTVPAGWWQAARSLGAYSLVGCTVGPGFDFADFAFLRDDAALAQRLAALDADAATLL